jgi:hypothetical protein
MRWWSFARIYALIREPLLPDVEVSTALVLTRAWYVKTVAQVSMGAAVEAKIMKDQC